MISANGFNSGRSQAVRLPKRYRFKSREVNIQPTPEGLLLTERTPWDLFHEGVAELSADYTAERVQPPLDARSF